MRRPPDGTLPGERARHESVIVKKAADRLELPSRPDTPFPLSVGGPARRPGDVEVVAPRVSNRLAGFDRVLYRGAVSLASILQAPMFGASPYL